MTLVLTSVFLTIRLAAPARPEPVEVVVAARDLPAGSRLSSTDLRKAMWPAASAPAGRLTALAGQVLASPVRAGEPVTDARVLGPGLLTGQPPGTVAVPVRISDPAAAALAHPGDRVDVLTAPASSTSSLADLADGTDFTDSSPVTGSSAVSGSSSPTGSSPTGSSPTGSSSLAGSPSVAGSSSPAGSGFTAGTSSVAGANVHRLVADVLVLAVPGAGLADQGSGGTEDGGLGGLGSFGTGSSDTSSGLLVLAVTSSQANRLAAAQPEAYLGIALLPRP